MAIERVNLTITVTATDAATGAAAHTAQQTWHGLSYADWARMERILHETQEELVQWAEADAKGRK